MNDNYNPVAQAMQVLQTLGARRAQQQQNELAQQNLALDQQRLAQQGEQFGQNLSLDQQRLALAQQQFQQQGSQFDRTQALTEAAQQYNQGRNAQLDPIEMAYRQAQTQGVQMNLQQAPELLRIQQLEAASRASRIPLEQSQLGMNQQELQARQAQNERQNQLAELELALRAFPPGYDRKGNTVFDPRLLPVIQKMFPAPIASAPSVVPNAYDTPANQSPINR